MLCIQSVAEKHGKIRLHSIRSNLGEFHWHPPHGAVGARGQSRRCTAPCGAARTTEGSRHETTDADHRRSGARWRRGVQDYSGALQAAEVHRVRK